MSRWQRIGVVASVLWLIGAPIYFVVAQNQYADNYYAWCRTGKGAYADAKDQQAHQKCRSLSGRKSLSDLGQALAKGDGVLWAMLLTPLAVMWVLGSAVIGAMRWIMRGFSPPTQGPAAEFSAFPSPPPKQ
jgi:hypothetical protein